MSYLKKKNIYNKFLVISTSILFFVFSCTPPISNVNTNKSIFESTKFINEQKISQIKNGNISPFKFIVNNDKNKENYNVENNLPIDDKNFQVSSSSDFTKSGELNLNGKRAFYVTNFKHQRSYKINIKSKKPVIYSMYYKHAGKWTLISHYEKKDTTKDSEFIFTYENSAFSIKTSKSSDTIVAVINSSSEITETTLSIPPPSYKVNEQPNNTREFEIPISTDKKVALATSFGLLTLDAGQTGKIKVEYDVITGEKSFSFEKDFGVIKTAQTISLSGEISNGLTVEGKIVNFSFEMVSSPENEIYLRVCVGVGADIKVFAINATMCGTSEGNISTKIGLTVFDTFSISATLFEDVHICKFLDNRGYIYLSALKAYDRSDFINKNLSYLIRVPYNENLKFNLNLVDCDGNPLSMISDDLDVDYNSFNSRLYYNEVDPSNFSKVLVENFVPIISDSSNITLNMGSIDSRKTIKVFAQKTYLSGVKKTIPTYINLEPTKYDFDFTPSSNEGNILNISLVKRDDKSFTFKVSKKDKSPFKLDTDIYLFKQKTNTLISNSIIDRQTIPINSTSYEFVVNNKDEYWSKNDDNSYSRELYFIASNSNLWEAFPSFVIKKYIYQGATLKQG